MTLQASFSETASSVTDKSGNCNVKASVRKKWNLSLFAFLCLPEQNVRCILEQGDHLDTIPENKYLKNFKNYALDM